VREGARGSAMGILIAQFNFGKRILEFWGSFPTDKCARSQLQVDCKIIKEEGGERSLYLNSASRERGLSQWRGLSETRVGEVGAKKHG
jgi:hypothetical protein